MPRQAATIDHHLRRNLRSDVNAKRAAAVIDRVILQSWNRILALISPPADSPFRPMSPSLVRAEVERLVALLPRVYSFQMIGLAAWGHASAARSISAATRRSRKREDRDDDVFGRNDPSFGSGVFDKYDPREFGFKTATGRTLADFTKYDYGRYLVEPPSAETLARLVGPPPPALTKLGADRAASTVWSGIANGFDRREIAQALRPMFDGYAVAARRTVRTEGARIATATQLDVSEQLADEIVGYMINAVPRTKYSRPDHLARSGTIYYREPGSGQKSMTEMPRPPIDSDGEVCYSCRCWLSPVFKD